MNFFALLFVPLAFYSHSQTTQASSQPVGFEQAMQQFTQTSIYKSFEKDLESIRLDFQSRDLLLQPILEARAGRSREQRELLFRPPTVRPETDLWTLSVRKPFSTGTTLGVFTSFEDAETPSVAPGGQVLAEWQLTFSQSLWRDGFGRATDLRRSREDFEQRQQLASTLLARAQSMVEFESLYWDWALVIKEGELQEKNLKRGREILKWVKDRFSRAAAEKTDYLNAQALLVRRELQVTSIDQRVTQALTRIERFVPKSGFRPNPNDLSQARDINQMVSDWIPSDELKVQLPLDFLALANEAEAQKLRAKEVRESIRPEVNIEGFYGKNAIDPQSNSAIDRAFRENNEASSVGVVFRTGLDVSREYKQAKSAKSRAEALMERKIAFEGEAQIAWKQLQTELKDLSSQIKRAEELVKVQTERSEAEKLRYRRGRTTAFEAISFEQEIAESEIMLWTLYSLMRKTEARARLFARTYESH